MKKVFLSFLSLLLPAFLRAQGCIPSKFYPYISGPNWVECYGCTGTIEGDEPEMTVSWLKYCPPVENQGKCNSCVAWAMCYYALTIKASIRKKSKVIPFSPYFVCAHTGKCDKGMTLVEANEVIRAHRSELSATKSFDECPAPICCTDSRSSPRATGGYGDGLLNEVDSYAKAGLIRIPDTKILCTYLSHQPVLLIMDLNTIHQEPDKTNDFICVPGVLDPTKKTNCHAVCVIGYNKNKDYVLVVNSRGKKWGDNGFARISMEHLQPDNVQLFAWEFSLQTW